MSIDTWQYTLVNNVIRHLALETAIFSVALFLALFFAKYAIS